MASECLLLLQNDDLDPDQLAEKLGQRFQSAPEQATREQVRQLLLTLSELGLITSVSA
jgi:hypothetical protein